VTDVGANGEPWGRAELRLRTCGRVISLAPDKMAALADLASGFGRDINDGYLTQSAVGDRLQEVADAYGLVAEHGTDVVAETIAQGLESAIAPWPGLSHGTVPTRVPVGHPASGGWPAATRGTDSARLPVGHPVTTLDICEFLARRFPPREMMFAPWLPTQGIAMIHAPRGIGKTHVALGTAWAIHAGAGFLRWKAPRARRVLLLDGEMPAVVLQERLKRIAEVSEHPAQPENLQLAAADLISDGLPDLSHPDAQKFYARVVDVADVVIVDNVSTLCRGLKENDADSWTPVQDWALQLRRAGKSVVFVHHAGKTGTQRGTSRKEDVLDAVISLRRPPDYSSDQGARFEIYYEKSRGWYGADAEPFEAWLTGNQWTVGPVKAGDDIETIRTLKRQGLSLRQIAERTGLSRSTIQRRLDDGEGDQ
jgi:hypothetical protein